MQRGLRHGVAFQTFAPKNFVSKYSDRVDHCETLDHCYLYGFSWTHGRHAHMASSVVKLAFVIGRLRVRSTTFDVCLRRMASASFASQPRQQTLTYGPPTTRL